MCGMVCEEDEGFGGMERVFCRRVFLYMFCKLTSFSIFVVVVAFCFPVPLVVLMYCDFKILTRFCTILFILFSLFTRSAACSLCFLCCTVVQFGGNIAVSCCV